MDNVGTGRQSRIGETQLRRTAAQWLTCFGIVMAMAAAAAGMSARAQTAATQAAPVESKPMTVAQAVAALKTGGYVVYFRHAATNFSQNDEKMRNFDDCANQRNLTDAGREQSRKIGAAWRALGIPVGRVSASPFCRTREVAQLAFGRYERAEEARGGPGTAGDPARYRPLADLLATAPKRGTNDVIVSHGNPFQALHPGTSYLREGEAAIIRPLGNGNHEVVARIASDEWPAL
ncbi:MAG: histidine phosphatase family protein [Betaproteobacteria bacterium]